ncbi:MAG: hypothetical protein WDM81_03585 [Rhizomicrobium sp.]
MMQPIPDGSTDTGYTPDRERHPSPIHVLSAGDHDIYSRAFDAADRGDWTAARGLAQQGHDATATRLVTWRYLLDKTSGASFSDIDGFAKNNPDWPLRDTLLARAEAAMDPAMAPQAVIAWYGGAQSGHGSRHGAAGRCDDRDGTQRRRDATWCRRAGSPATSCRTRNSPSYARMAGS